MSVNNGNNFTSLQLIKEYVNTLREENKEFNREFHAEILKIWQEIIAIKGDIKILQDRLKSISRFWGIVGGAIPAIITILISLFIYWITKHAGKI